MNNQMKRFRLIFVGLALVILFGAERYFHLSDVRLPLVAVAVVLLGLGLIVNGLQYRRALRESHDKEARTWLLSGSWVAMLMVGLVFYVLFQLAMGDSGSIETPLQKVLLGTWLSLTILSCFAGIGAEVGLGATGSGDLAEPLRVKLGMQTWLGIGLLLGSLVCINYIASKIDRAWDLSYLKTTKPGESTLKIVDSLEEELTIGAFFERDSEVAPMVREYLEQIASRNKAVVLNFYSKDFFPSKAEEFRVSRDGQVILMKDKKRQRIDIGEDIAMASSKLRKFDQLFQKELLAAISTRKNVYVSTNHGEMSWKEKRTPTRSFGNAEKILKSLNYNVRTLNATQGGISTVPSDAALVIIPGASQPFTQQEITVLRSYLESGGNLLVFFDVEFSGEERSIGGLTGGENLQEFVANLGIQFSTYPLANDQKFISNTRKSVDHYFLFTNKFTSHQSMSNLSKNDDSLGVITFRSGVLEAVANVPEGWTVRPTVQSLDSSFLDKNQNTKFDGDEIRKSYLIGMAAESKKSKVISFADATMISDPVILNPGNASLLVDSVRWLVGQSDIIGETISEEDIKIQHSKSRDLIVFHGSIYLVPILVLIFGFFANRSRKLEEAEL